MAWPQIGHILVLLSSSSAMLGRDGRGFDGCCPAGCGEGMTTPLTCASCCSNDSTMVGDLR